MFGIIRVGLHRLLMPCVPGIHVAAKWTHAVNQDWVLAQLSLQKMSGQDVRTHHPMILLAMTLEIKLSPFFRDSKLTFFLVWRSSYIVSEALSPSLMVGRLFGSLWCPQGGGRAIITLQAVVRDRGRQLAIAPILSFCRRRNVGGGRLSGMTQQGLLATVNDLDHRPG